MISSVVALAGADLLRLDRSIAFFESFKRIPEALRAPQNRCKGRKNYNEISGRSPRSRRNVRFLHANVFPALELLQNWRLPSRKRSIDREARTCKAYQPAPKVRPDPTRPRGALPQPSARNAPRPPLRGAEADVPRFPPPSRKKPSLREEVICETQQQQQQRRR